MHEFFGHVVATGIKVAEGQDKEFLLHIDAVTLHGFDHVVDGHEGGNPTAGDDVAAIAAVQVFHDGDEAVLFRRQDDVRIVEAQFPGVGVAIAEVEIGIGEEAFAYHQGQLAAHEVVHVATQGMVFAEFLLDVVPHAPDKALFFVEVGWISGLNLIVELPNQVAHEQGFFDAVGGRVTEIFPNLAQGHVHDGLGQGDDTQFVQNGLPLIEA